MKDPISVVIIGPSTRFLSGISYYTMRLSNALSAEVDVTAILFRNMLPKRLFPGWKRIDSDLSSIKFNESINVLEILDWYNPLSWISAMYHVRKSDIIIFQWWTSSVSHMYLALELMNFRAIPVIIEFHEVIDPLENSIFLIRAYSRIMASLIRRLSIAYIVHSEADRELIAQKYSIDKEKITVIPHGLYDQYPQFDKPFAKKQLGIEEENVILFFGLLRPYKGVKFLIKAFEQLPEKFLKTSHLLIVGEAWEDHESVKLASQSPVANKITMVNRYISDEEIPVFFSAADVLVLPYTRASQSGVAHIGMTYGLPIIASDVGGLKEGLQHYNGSFLIPPKSVEDIKKCLLTVLMPKLHYNLPDELRWDNISKKWLQFLQKSNQSTKY
jgi:glycosyltransferase involved in cell wall biosynthesis